MGPLMNLNWVKYLLPEEQLKVNEELKLLKENKLQQDQARLIAFENQFVESSDAEKLVLLHPIFKVMVRKTLVKAKRLGIRLGIHAGGRSILEQNGLYHQGRKLENGIWVEIDPVNHSGIVTNAPGGSSWHNYFLAADLVMDGSTKPGYQWSWNGNIDANVDGKNDWTQLGEIAESFGLTWGGRWRPPSAPVDVPHLQYHVGIDSVVEAHALFRKSGIKAVWERVI